MAIKIPYSGLDSKLQYAFKEIELYLNRAEKPQNPMPTPQEIIQDKQSIKIADNLLTRESKTALSANQGNVLLKNIAEWTLKNGFENYDNDSIISFVDATRTFTIAPTSISYNIYSNGKKYRKTTTKTITITDIEGIHIIYFDGNGIIQEISNPTSLELSNIFQLYCMISILYWDATNNVSISFLNERHGSQMSGTTHRYLHFKIGLIVRSGCRLNNINSSGNGNNNADAQFGTNNGEIADEDLELSVEAIGSTVGLDILYFEGTNGNLRKTTTAGYSVIRKGTGRLAYNQYIGGAWQQTEVSNNDYVLCHIFAYNNADGSKRMVAVQGQNSYTTLKNARNGANVEISALYTGQLPLPEFRAIATVIFQTSNSYLNAVKARIVKLEDGADYVDWLNTELKTGSVTQHNILSGRSDLSCHPIGAINGSIPYTIPYLNSSATALSESSGLKFDGTNLMLGSGITTPKDILHIEKSGSVDTGIIVTTDQNSNISYIKLIHDSTLQGGLLLFDDADSRIGGISLYRDPYHDFIIKTKYSTGIIERFRITSSGKLTTGGENAPDCVVGGLTMRVEYAGGVAYSLKRHGSSHGLTSYFEADTSFTISSVSGGRSYINIITDGNEAIPLAFSINGYLRKTADTSTTTESIGVIDMNSRQHNGAGVISSIANGGNIFTIKNNNAAKLILKGDGTLYVKTNKMVACGGGTTGSNTTPNGTVALEINGVTYYLLKASSA